MVSFPKIEKDFKIHVDKYRYDITDTGINYKFTFDNGTVVSFTSDAGVPFNLDDPFIRDLVENYIIGSLTIAA